MIVAPMPDWHNPAAIMGWFSTLSASDIHLAVVGLIAVALCGSAVCGLLAIAKTAARRTPERRSSSPPVLRKDAG